MKETGVNKLAEECQKEISSLLGHDAGLKKAIKERDDLLKSKRRMEDEYFDLEVREKELNDNIVHLKRNLEGSTLIQGAEHLAELKQKLAAIVEIKEIAQKQFSSSSDLQKKIDDANRSVFSRANAVIMAFRDQQQQKVDDLRQETLDRIKAYDRAVLAARNDFGITDVSNGFTGRRDGLRFNTVLDFEGYYTIPTRYRN